MRKCENCKWAKRIFLNGIWCDMFESSIKHQRLNAIFCGMYHRRAIEIVKEGGKDV